MAKKKKAICKQCGEKTVYAKGLCRACYAYQLTNDGKQRTPSVYRNRVTESDANEFAALLLAGESLTAIAGITGFNINTVRSHLGENEALRAGREEEIDHMLTIRNRIRAVNPSLTLEQVEAIRKEREAGTQLSELAKKYGVSKSTISRVSNRKIYVLSSDGA